MNCLCHHIHQMTLPNEILLSLIVFNQKSFDACVSLIRLTLLLSIHLCHVPLAHHRLLLLFYQTNWSGANVTNLMRSLIHTGLSTNSCSNDSARPSGTYLSILSSAPNFLYIFPLAYVRKLERAK